MLTVPVQIESAAARALVLRAQSYAPQTPSPLLLLVSIKKQRLRVFDASGAVTESRISSGQPGFDTPTGVFSILEKNEYHESNIYDGAPMPHMQRLTWSGIAMHAGVVPGYRASHGCIRLPASFATSLFGITKVGNRVVVTPDEAVPIAFDHPNLFKPLPAETPKAVAAVPAGDTTKVASNDITSASLAEMPQFLGVSPALAEAVRDTDAFKPERPRSRAEVDRMVGDKINKLQSAARAAEAQRVTATERAKAAVRDGDAAAQSLTAAKQKLDPARAAIEAADKKLKDAQKAFEDFMTGAATSTPAPRSDAKEPKSLDDREADLEETILDLTVDADTARADYARREMDIAGVQAAASSAEATRAAAIDGVRQNQAQLRSVQTDLVEANKDLVRRAKPISVFISLKTERIYIRQGVDPLLEAPITLTNSGRRFGTHVFTAMRYGTDQNTFDWRLVSAHLPASADADDDSASRKGRRRDPGLPLTNDASVRMARAALDGIKIPPDIQQTITELARPGASLIVSDRELPPGENGLGTEFVVLTR